MQNIPMTPDIELPRNHQAIIDNLDLMLRARYPLIYIVGAEEEPIEEVLRQVIAF